MEISDFSCWNIRAYKWVLFWEITSEISIQKSIRYRNNIIDFLLGTSEVNVVGAINGKYRMLTHSNWWSDTGLITWYTNRNLRIFLDWHSSKGKVGTPHTTSKGAIPITYFSCYSLIFSFVLCYTYLEFIYGGPIRINVNSLWFACVYFENILV